MVGSGENSGKERELEVVRVQTTKNERKKKDSIRKTDQSPEITILKKMIKTRLSSEEKRTRRATVRDGEIPAS